GGDFTFEKLRRRVAPRIKKIPAAQFDFAKLRVIELVPIDIAPAFQLVIAPLQQLEIIFDRVFPIPLDKLEVVDAGLPLRTPDFYRPHVHPQMGVNPVKTAGDDLLRVILEVVED